MPPAPALGRAAGLLVMVVLAWQILARGLDFDAASGALRFIHGIDLVVHEAGHTFAFFLPRFLYILAGSVLQVFLPAVCAVTFLRQGQPASFAVALFWTGESITDVAIYMADAKKQAPLLGGEGVTHDWNYLLVQLHLLGAADFLGRLTWLLGVGVIVAAIALLANETRLAWRRPQPS